MTGVINFGMYKVVKAIGPNERKSETKLDSLERQANGMELRRQR